MELSDLLKRQQEIGKTIEQMAFNFKKDSLARKTSEYADKRMKSLTALWKEFTLNHARLVKADIRHDQEPYFIENYFEELEKLRSRFRSWIADIGGPSQQVGYSSGVSNEVVHEPLRPVDGAGQQMLERLIRKQTNLELTIKYYLASIDREEDQGHSSHYYQLKIDRLLAYENDLNEIVNLIIEESSEDILENIAKSHELQQQLQSKIIDLQQRLDIPQSVTNIMGSQHVSLQNRVKLPKLTLPVFDGDYLLWTQFHDLYVQLIQTQPLSNTEKMFYLASNLSGEARALIRHLSVTSDNYETAWGIIVSRYNNTRLIVTATLNKLLNQPPINSDCANDVKSLHDVTKECYLALKNRQIAVDTWNPILLHLLLKKLDKNTHTLYEQSLENPKEFGFLEDFLQFLEGRFHTLETVQRDEISKRQRPPGHQKSKSVLTAGTQQDCLCTPRQHHRLYHCKEFLSLKPDKRVQYLIKTSRCLNCLKTGHFANQCTSRGCLKCNKKHNTLVHLPELSKTKQPRDTTLSEPPSITNTATLTTNIERAKSGYVLLGTAAVKISVGENKFITCKALLDSGSQINIVTERLARKLGIEQTRNSVVIEGVGNTVQRVSGRINVHVTSTSTNFAVHMEAFVLKKITGIQPADYINTQSWPIPMKFQLADANFNQPGRIDLLIGAEFYHQLMLPEKHTMSPELPILQNSLLGWIVTGKVVDSDSKANGCNICTACDTDTNLSKQIERFWRLEETNIKHNFTESEERCERQFKQETSRDAQGRFVVRLPFKEDPNCLGESKDMALRRFFALERRLAANKDIKNQYVEFMNEYLRLNHMKPVKLAELRPPYYFLPHHFVCKPDSTTTKLRVVFDASAKTTTNISLNDVLSKGPVIQDELFSILLRFRMPRFVFTGDIEKMYRQVLLHEDDQRYQLIFWRNDAEEELKCYQLTTITYGTTSAPYLAIKSLQTLGEQRSKQYPLGSRVVKRGFYVDDVMTGSDNITEAFQMQTELMSLLKEGGFRLRKWCANHPRLLERFQPQDMEVVLNFNDDSDERIKTLGLTWCPKQDVFRVKPHIPVRDTVTKRTAYSDIAHIFDPLGILSPVVVTAKLLLQQMWTLKSDWDDQLPSQLEYQWRKFRSSLDDLQDFAFPRHVFDHQLPKNIQLHTFADASEKAFGAAVYVRFFTKDKWLLVRLLCAKSKVAPTRKETIPRLELCAAKLAADLCNRVKTDLDLGSVEEFYWTDSTIVLDWLNQPSSSQQTFVANRVAAIQRLTVVKNWRHVESQENPADVLSRGTTTSKFKNCSIWFYGPVFLHGVESSWPPAYSPQTMKALSIAITPDLTSTIKGIEHGNSFAKLQRILAYVIRFSKRLRKITNHQEHLTPEELELAL